ncbi:ABC transporter ATP-binding protein [Anaerotruncus colihominis]|uniref:ABC transporter ATP-binding protein n=1 Tax=Anaerotruncus colihominis TaxID=169435 RepID=UPI0026738EF2|nr:dipeptide ABC transporter ATP-binding protein [Anaerotruncus colihominis]
MTDEKKPLLAVRDLKVYYPIKVRSRGIFSQKKLVRAVDGISFDVYEGETLGIVGESGCGKSTTGKTIVRLNRPTAGSVTYDGMDLFSCPPQAQARISREIQIVFQDPYSSLDPRFTVGRSIAEPLVVHKAGAPAERRARVVELMRAVGLREDVYDRYPHEFSGGQRQRVGVARALALNPKLLVCDEPVSALDVSIQAQILNLMQQLQAQFGLTYIFISHNLSVVEHVCNRILVMYLGHIVETAGTEELFKNPLHPYTRALMDAVPIPDPELHKDREPLGGDVPSPVNPPPGCPFCTRCPKVMDVCRQQRPQPADLGGHIVNCHLYQSQAPYQK